MRILVDGDACPSKDIVFTMARKYQLAVIVFMDYAHIPSDNEYEVVQCEVGNDSVDLQIINRLTKGDLVITQDYGLAGLVISRGALVMHVSGKIINEDNIDELLMSRYLSAKQRKAGRRVKGPAKRTKEDVLYFEQQLETIVKEAVKSQ